MVRVTLSVRKTLDEVAAAHFESAKKARRKRTGATQTIERISKTVPTNKPKPAQRARKKEWYERFRWAHTADGSLIVGGRDAATNEIVLKKHLEPTDQVFHTESPGSPFVLLKGPPSAENMHAAAQLCANYSKAWSAGLGHAEVFAVKADQVSKSAQAGEFLARGAFMVRGERTHFTVPLELTLGIANGVPTAGLASDFLAKQQPHAILVPGKELASDIAKKLVKKLGASPDEWVSLLPGGGSVLKAVHAPAKHGAKLREVEGQENA